MKRLIGAAIFMLFAGFATTIAMPASVGAATPGPDPCARTILGIPNWYRGLTSGPDCDIVGPGSTLPGASKPLEIGEFIWKVALNVIEIGLFLAGFITLFFIMFGGFQFLTGGSIPGQIEKARLTIIHASIGLGITMAAIAAVNLIFRVING